MLKDDVIGSCRRFLASSGPILAGGVGSRSMPVSHSRDVPRLLGCISGHLRVRLMRPGGQGCEAVAEAVLPASGCAVLPPRAGFDHRHTRRAVFFNLSLRPEGVLVLRRSVAAGTWRPSGMALIPQAECPQVLAEAIALAGAVALERPACTEALRGSARSAVALLQAAVADGLARMDAGAASPDLRWLQLLDHIDEHLGAELDRSSVGAAIGVHPNHVSRLCTRHGLRFVDLVHRRRIQAACRSMVEDERPIAAIAIACGFGSPQHFSRIFRQLHGCTPGAWRSAHRLASRS